MAYNIPATSKTPALIVYLLDASGSMQQDCGGKTRIDVVNDALHRVIVKMVQRSTKGTIVSPRYRIAMYAYSTQVIDLLSGIKTIAELAPMGVPRLTTMEMTDTASAFLEAERLLRTELPNLQDCPAPLICHMTDGEYNVGDPRPVVQRIMNMSVPDGNVLVANIHITTSGLTIPDVVKWPGILSEDQLPDSYSKTLFGMSSPVPDSYRSVMREFGYQLDAGSRMLFPGDQPELVELGFVMSAATPLTPLEDLDRLIAPPA
jgi:hypothetical protein